MKMSARTDHQKIILSKHIYDKFKELRGKNVLDLGVPFWDLVVLTAANPEQAAAFEILLEAKQKQGAIPSGVEYRIFADPPGPRAGCGGSTMHVINQLHKLHSEKLFKMKVLLLNAGGQSQRLPSSSILGKLFMTLPLGEPPYSLFELKLACYLPFLDRMKPGIFHAAADTIEVFDLGKTSDWNFNSQGFTAVAHPSSLDIGTTHGVFVLDRDDTGGSEAYGNNDSPKSDNLKPSDYACMCRCVRVLQKPSVEIMEKEKAIVASCHGTDQSKIVYTDSFFFFEHSVTKKFLDFYEANSPLECEIDAYGDFLQPLGPNATIDYTRNVNNVSNIDPKLVETREKIFHLLHGTPLNLILLKISRFYHLGTFKEYLHHLTEDKILAAEIGLVHKTFNKFIRSEENEPQPKRARCEVLQGCLMHNLLHAESKVAESSVIEYCHISVPITVGKHCVLSNCFVTSIPTGLSMGDSIVIPDKIFMHTIPVSINNKTQYVTVFQHVDDNMKGKAEQSKASDLKFLNQPLDLVAKCYQLDSATELADEGPDCDMVAVWNCQFFPLCSDMQESFFRSLGYIQSIMDGRQIYDVNASERVSLKETTKCCEVALLCQYRNSLHLNILSTDST